MNPRHRTAFGVLLAGCLSIGLAAGCENRPGKKALPPASAPVEATESPTAVARAYLVAVRDELDAIARGDRAAALAQQTLQRGLIAAAELEERFRERTAIRALFGNDLAAGFAPRWSAMLSYYVAGLDFEKLVVDPTAVLSPSGGGARTTVLVFASGSRDSTWIRLRCAQGADGRWRVLEVDFAAAPRPATQSAPAP